MIARNDDIKGWTEDDLLALPAHETAEYEFKSSLSEDDDLGPAIRKAASAFWNSGGGVLVIGVDDKGKIDGGISEAVGKQTREDWIHRAISKVSHQGQYHLKLISGKNNSSSIRPNHLVTVIAFEESPLPPHMADGTYYTRAGTHSDPASHFIVEALFAKRSVQSPVIRAVLINSERKTAVIELAVLVVNDSAALNVEVSFDPLPKIAEHVRDSFPLCIPVIDQRHPFTMELFRMLLKSEMFGSEPVLLKLDYEDVLGNKHHYEQQIDVAQ
jgi:hypothetical protein